jgi:hypothetical protein
MRLRLRRGFFISVVGKSWIDRGIMPLRRLAGFVGASTIAVSVLISPAPAMADSLEENCNDSNQCIAVIDAKVSRYRTLLTVEGSGFTPNTTVEIHQEGSRPGGHIFTNVKKNMTVTTDADGRFHVTFKAQKQFRASASVKVCRRRNADRAG